MMSRRNQQRNSPKPLTPREKDIIEDLEGLSERFKEYDDLTMDEIQHFSPEEQDRFGQFQKDYDEVILKALRANLDRHPRVPDKIKNLLITWVRNHQGWGNKELLRKAKPRGIEVGVKGPYTKHEIMVLGRVERMRRGDEDYQNKGKGMTWEAIHKILTDDGTIAKMSRWALRKWIRNLDPSID